MCSSSTRRGTRRSRRSFRAKRFWRACLGVRAIATALRRASASSSVASIASGEIDVVITRAHVFGGRWQALYDEVAAFKQACGRAHMKVILGTGDLLTLRNVGRASVVAMMAGADFIKTSTGKVGVSATLPTALVMLESVRDFAELTGTLVGVKVAGGIRSTKEALRYLVVVNETVGYSWLNPDGFRFGASSLLNDLLMQRLKQHRGAYVRPDEFSGD